MGGTHARTGHDLRPLWHELWSGLVVRLTLPSLRIDVSAKPEA
jgi:hypothetical protein